MVTQLKSLVPKVKKEHPDVPGELIEEVVDVYFSSLRTLIENPSKPEIATLWSTLRINPGLCAKQVRILGRRLDFVEGTLKEVTQGLISKFENFLSLALTRPHFKSVQRKASFIKKIETITTMHPNLKQGSLKILKRFLTKDEFENYIKEHKGVFAGSLKES